MTLASLVAFAGLCLVLSLTPGPDTFLVLRIALNRPSAGIAAAAGSAVAAVAWAALVGLVAYKAMGWLRRPKVSTGVERISSGIITALGVGVIASGASS
ncbi:hypothetical protein [uncultured Arthrobacter sp.]|uniref:hypothetical protein n=1 Tax=uncultured Arthrobacter sp. TaxID=114050 RepID=UPI0028D1AE0E|nr:hypothetical protein [uncultured Arthrobacter sp.]